MATPTRAGRDCSRGALKADGGAPAPEGYSSRDHCCQGTRTFAEVLQGLGFIGGWKVLVKLEVPPCAGLSSALSAPCSTSAQAHDDTMLLPSA